MNYGNWQKSNFNFKRDFEEMKKINLTNRKFTYQPKVEYQKDYWLVVKAIVFYTILVVLIIGSIINSAVILRQRKTIEKLSQQTNEDRSFIKAVKEQYGNSVIQIMLKKGCEESK